MNAIRLSTRSAISRLSHKNAIELASSHPSSLIRGIPSPPTNFISSRYVTNASRAEYIPSLSQVPRVRSKPGGWHPTLVHSSSDINFSVIRLQPGGGEVPKHLHSVVWDYFLPISGEAVIEVTTNDGEEKNYEMREGSFLALPPEDVHRVRNLSETEEFVFFIAQSPRSRYDFVAK